MNDSFYSLEMLLLRAIVKREFGFHIIWGLGEVLPNLAIEENR